MDTQDKKTYWYQSPGDAKGFFYKGEDTLCGFMANCLHGGWVSDILNQIRQNPEGTKNLKKMLPAYTVSPVFDDPRNRKQEFVTGHTGLICLDIDDDHNPLISDWSGLRDKLFNTWKEVVAAALSASAKGIFLVIAINGVTVSSHNDYCIRLEKALKRIDIVVDPACKDITRLRFLTHDPELRHRHKHLFLDAPQSVVAKQPKSKNLHKPTLSETDRIFQAAVKSAQQKYGQFVKGNRHIFIASVTTFMKNAGVSPGERKRYVDNNLLDLNEIKSNCINLK